MTIDEVARDFTQLSEDRPDRFDELAEAVFCFQRENNAVYGRYCKSITSGRGAAAASNGPRSFSRPYLPIAAFKRAPVTTFPPEEAEHVFESSGTGSGAVSRHFVKDVTLYDRSIEAHFLTTFGDGPFLFATHLPHYAERGSRSSLLYMVEHLVRRFGAEGSGSFLDDPAKLEAYADTSVRRDIPLIVFGTAFGLLDLIESGTTPIPPDALVIETGGMKTYRREIRRSELHQRLSESFGVDIQQIRSEYGMCELLSQCYTRGEGTFYPPPWMRFNVLDPLDPSREVGEGEAGVLALYDLANIYTVSAILTEDRAVRRGAGFEVTGRLSGAELRGCNFLLENV